MKKSLRQKHLSKKWICQYLTRAILLCLLITVGHISFAQNPSTKNRFSVNYIEGCAPLTISLTDLSTITDNSAPILVHFNRNPNIPESLNGILNSMNTGGSIDTTYTTPGTYLVGQLNGNVANPNDRFDFIQVVVTESVPPIFTVATCINNTVLIDIDFGADSYDGYVIDFGDGQVQNITKNDSPNVSYTYSSQNNYTITITGKLASGLSTACGVATVPVTTIVNLPLPQITALEVQSTTTAILTYSSLDNNITYELEVDDGSGFSSEALLLPANNPNQYLIDDPAFDFENNTYFFRIMATEACGNNSGNSNEVPSVALTYSASYNSDQIDVTFNWQTSTTDLTEIFLLRMER